MNTKLNTNIILQRIIILSLISPLILKGIFVSYRVYSSTGDIFLGFIQVIANDSLMYSIILVVFYISFLEITHKIVAFILKLSAFLALIIYIIDIVLIYSFNTHLTLGDTIKYASYAPQYLSQISNFKDILVVVSSIGLLVIIMSLTFANLRIKEKKLHVLVILLIFSIFMWTLLPRNNDYSHSWIYENVVEYNLEVLSESNRYSENMINNIDNTFIENCYSKNPENPNIILLMVESLSAYQSNYFSGIYDWTPNLDTIARNNISFKNFYANGFCTEDAMISLLTGLPPIYPPAIYTARGGTSFNGFFNIKESLPNILKQKGYRSEYITTGDVGFGNARKWLKSIGFDYVEGYEHPFYKGWDRFHFESAPDEALYQRVLDRIKNEIKNKYFIYMSTLSTHHPFVNPENNNKSEAETFKYADKQLGIFYKKLMEADFFNDGILIIVGDHHSMIQISEEEKKLFGDLKAPARVAAVLSFGDKKHLAINEQYQQIDIFNGIKNLISETGCYSDWIGDPITTVSIPPKYIFHRRGDNRSVISVFDQNHDYLVKLDGDSTRFIGPVPENKESQDLIIRRINSERIKRTRTSSKQFDK